MQSQRSRGLLLALISTAVSSLAIVLQVPVSKTMAPILMSFISQLAGALLLALLLYGTGKRLICHIPRSLWRPILILTLTRSVLGNVLIWYGWSMTFSIKAMFFTKAEPYFILLWRWIFERQTIPRTHLALLMVHIVGAALLSVGDWGAFGYTQRGDSIILLAIAILSLSYRPARVVANHLGNREATVLSQALGSLILLPALLLVPNLSLSVSPKIWSFLVGAVLLWNVIGLVAWFAALRLIEPWIVSALRALGPLFAAPVAWYFFGERLTETQLIGAVVVLSTSALLAWERKDRKMMARELPNSSNV